ncbi:MAG: BON domain-containing protein [Candidatus Rokubacteria bacterium]|nr:BON domain-containing protein [Candidatus Rokubacteria bacterium]
MLRLAHDRSAALLLVAAFALTLLGAGGCRSLTGRTAGQWVSDHAITAKVKKRLAGVDTNTLVAVNVDTYEGVVYLSGSVDSVETKRRLEEVARTVKNVEQVVTNVAVKPGTATTHAAASPTTESVASRVDVGTHPLHERLPGLRRIEGDPVARPRGPWAAYDAAGRLVATIYTVSMPELAQQGLEDVRPVGGAVDHVAIYPLVAHDDVPQPQYHIVLWHVSRAEAARLR